MTMQAPQKTWDTLRSYAEKFHLDLPKFELLHGFFSTVEPEVFRKFAEAAPRDFPMEEAVRRFPGPALEKLLLLCIVANYGFVREKYRAEHWPQSMLDGILRDLRTWQDTLERDLGGYGLTPRIFEWCVGCLTGEVKSFGRLQGNSIHRFMPRKSIFRQPGGTLLIRDCDAPGNPPHPALTHGDNVLNVHIPATGKLDRGECLASLQWMQEFSARFQPDYDYRAIVCYSWLLDPLFQQFLKPDSNVVQFQKLGHVFLLDDHAEDTEIRWRLWGNAGTACPLEQLPARSSMERGILRTLQNGGHFHEGVLILFKEELPALIEKIGEEIQNVHGCTPAAEPLTA